MSWVGPIVAWRSLRSYPVIVDIESRGEVQSRLTIRC